MPIKLVAIDVDNTLLNSKHQMSPTTVSTLKQVIQKGIRVVIASGRAIKGTEWIYQKVNLDNKKDQYMINFNGGMIQTTSEKILFQDTLSPTEAQKLYQLACKLGFYLQLDARYYVYTPYLKIPAATLQSAAIMSTPIKYINPHDLKQNKNFLKAVFRSNSNQTNFYQKLPKTFFKKYSTKLTSEFDLEINHKKINKGAALKKLAKKLSIPIKQTMAIGDGNNDLQMIETAGTGVAMENGIPEIKKEANFITHTNDKEGVTLALKKFLLKPTIKD